MEPRLVVLTGPLEGQTISLSSESLTIGRHGSNALVLREVAVSRHHAVIETGGGAPVLRDLGSRHGLAVNAVPTAQRALAHGDLITLCSSTLLFQAYEAAALSGDSSAVWEDTTFLTDSTVALETAGTGLSGPEGILEALALPDEKDRALRVLLQAGAELGSHESFEELGEALLGSALEAVPAQRAALLLTAPGEDAFDPVLVRGAGGGEPESLPISRTAALRVLHQKVALLSNDVRKAEDLQGVASLEVSKVGALLAVPLLTTGPASKANGEASSPALRVEGVLYLDDRRPKHRFHEEDLRLLTALAGMAAPAFVNLKHLRWVDGERRRLLAETLDHDLVGESRAMARTLDLISRVAPTDSTVLLRGESGTGKELAAQAIHRGGPRRDKPFVAINCATLSGNLLESELFGHEKGAFTGALARKLGKLEVAAGGTLFLDEVGELPLELQAKLLRLLQEREFERVGGIRPIATDVRVIAATHRNLEGEIEGGSFRQDLFYRLNVIAIELPPLRDRRSDIPLLVHHFSTTLSARLQRMPPRFSPRAMELLERYGWPGNVRELANTVERALVLCPDEIIRPEDLPESLWESSAPETFDGSGYHQVLRETKKTLILQAVEKSGGNITEAAKALDLHPNYLHRLIRNLELRSRLP